MKSSKAAELIKSLCTKGTSDLHFKVGRPPMRRILNSLKVAEGFDPFTHDDLTHFIRSIVSEQMWNLFEQNHELDTSFSIPGFSRFRLNLFYQRGSLAVVMRVVPFAVPTLNQLKAPVVLEQIAMATRGLILVTGATGSGKSSTLAGMIHHINQYREAHIITIEDPIEFLHKDHSSSVNQREVGIDTKSFANAFRASLRQDPDIILVGELRDVETMEIALQAAETGHLVMSTIHTTSAKETIGRFIDSFPPFQQKQIRMQLAANLKAVVSQRLLQKKDSSGRILACEIMINTSAIKSCILDPAKEGDIVNLIEKGAQHGMQTFDQVILEMYEDEIVSKDEALVHATSPNDMSVKLSLM